LRSTVVKIYEFVLPCKNVQAICQGIDGTVAAAAAAAAAVLSLLQIRHQVMLLLGADAGRWLDYGQQPATNQRRDTAPQSANSKDAES